MSIYSSVMISIKCAVRLAKYTERPEIITITAKLIVILLLYSLSAFDLHNKHFSQTVLFQ